MKEVERVKAEGRLLVVIKYVKDEAFVEHRLDVKVLTLEVEGPDEWTFCETSSQAGRQT